MAKPKAKKAGSSSESSASEQKKKRKAKKEDASASQEEEKLVARKQKEGKKEGKEKGKEKDKVKEKAKDTEKVKAKDKDEDKPKKDKPPKEKEKDGDKPKEKDKGKAKGKAKDEEQSEVEDGTGENGPEIGEGDLLVAIDMTDKKGLGIEVDWANGTSLRIKDVKKEGAIPDWNKGRAPNQSVYAEDHIISVNGKTGDPKAMLAECRAKKKLRFVVWVHCQRPAELPSKSRSPKRKSSQDPKSKLADAEAALAKSLAKVHRRGAAQPLEFMVSLDMSRHTLLGVDADFSNGKTLFIKSIIPGAVEEWNKGCQSGRAVEAGFQIIAVNGYAGDAQGMAGLCKELCDANSQLQLRIRGLPPPPSPLAQAVS